MKLPFKDPKTTKIVLGLSCKCFGIMEKKRTNDKFLRFFLLNLAIRIGGKPAMVEKVGSEMNSGESRIWARIGKSSWSAGKHTLYLNRIISNIFIINVKHL